MDFCGAFFGFAIICIYPCGLRILLLKSLINPEMTLNLEGVGMYVG
jgi:hypothetical protein